MANYKNGEVPASMLAPLTGQPNAFLRSDAAASWNRAKTDVLRRTGVDIRARGWNRTLAEQEMFFHRAYKPQASGGTDPRWYKGTRYVRRPGHAAAAIPGTSNHGWGIAVDVENFGVENQWNSPRRAKAFPIMAEHGWTDHSGRSIGEPWHVEYDPARDKHKNDRPAPLPKPEPVPQKKDEDDMYGAAKSFYIYLVGRAGSEYEIAKWASQAIAAGLTQEQLRQKFLDGKAEEATVIAAYHEFLQRGPSAEDIKAWLKGGPTVRQVRDGIAGSPEAQK